MNYFSKCARQYRALNIVSLGLFFVPLFLPHVQKTLMQQKKLITTTTSQIVKSFRPIKLSCVHFTQNFSQKEITNLPKHIFSWSIKYSDIDNIVIVQIYIYFILYRVIFYFHFYLPPASLLAYQPSTSSSNFGRAFSVLKIIFTRIVYFKPGQGQLLLTQLDSNQEWYHPSLRFWNQYIKISWLCGSGTKKNSPGALSH